MNKLFRDEVGSEVWVIYKTTHELIIQDSNINNNVYDLMVVINVGIMPRKWLNK